MTRMEFANSMAFIAAAIQKPLPKESAEVYFELLGDLPLEALQLAAKRVVLEHRWATFPTVAELREAASDILRGQLSSISAAEAWAAAWQAAGRIDLDVAGSADRALAKVPPLVQAAMKAYGIPDLCHGKEPVTVVRSQFMKMFDQLAAKATRQALLPASMQEAITARSQPLPLLTNIGAEPSERTCA